MSFPVPLINRVFEIGRVFDVISGGCMTRRNGGCLRQARNDVCGLQC